MEELNPKGKENFDFQYISSELDRFSWDEKHLLSERDAIATFVFTAFGLSLALVGIVLERLLNSPDLLSLLSALAVVVFGIIVLEFSLFLSFIRLVMNMLYLSHCLGRKWVFRAYFLDSLSKRSQKYWRAERLAMGTLQTIESHANTFTVTSVYILTAFAGALGSIGGMASSLSFTILYTSCHTTFNLPSSHLSIGFFISFLVIYTIIYILYNRHINGNYKKLILILIEIFVGIFFLTSWSIALSCPSAARFDIYHLWAGFIFTLFLVGSLIYAISVYYIKRKRGLAIMYLSSLNSILYESK